MGAQTAVVRPRWNPVSGQFADGSTTIAEAFARLVSLYGTPAAESPAVNAGTSAQAPDEDILGHPRNDGQPDIGAVEFGFLFADGFESGDTSAWSSTFSR